jgi:hypothetical protein
MLSLSWWIGHVRLSYNPYFSTCFLVGVVFFSYNKSANNTFNHIFSAKQTGSQCLIGRMVPTSPAPDAAALQ